MTDYDLAPVQDADIGVPHDVLLVRSEAVGLPERGHQQEDGGGHEAVHSRHETLPCHRVQKRLEELEQDLLLTGGR